MSRVSACVTVYGDAEGLAVLCDALASQTHPVERLYVVDNSPVGVTGPLRSLGWFAERAVVLQHPENVGVSGALAMCLARAREEDHRYLWCFDQDSLPSTTCLELLLRAAAPGRNPPVAIACALPLVGAGKAPLHGLDFRRFRFERLTEPEVADRLRATPCPHYECDASITSGMLVDLDATRGVPLVDEDLFIDGVDHGMSMRARSAGLALVVVPRATMEHTLGAPQESRSLLLRRRITTPGYSALRLRYICRNHTWLEMSISKGAWKVVCALWRFKFAVWHAMLALSEHEGRRGKIFACLRGTWEGFQGRLGRIPGTDQAAHRHDATKQGRVTPARQDRGSEQ